jgi:hypothetical protein
VGAVDMESTWPASVTPIVGRASARAGDQLRNVNAGQDSLEAGLAIAAIDLATRACLRFVDDASLGSVRAILQLNAGALLFRFLDRDA